MMNEETELRERERERERERGGRDKLGVSGYMALSLQELFIVLRIKPLFFWNFSTIKVL